MMTKAVPKLYLLQLINVKTNEVVHEDWSWSISKEKAANNFWKRLAGYCAVDIFRWNKEFKPGSNRPASAIYRAEADELLDLKTEPDSKATRKLRR